MMILLCAVYAILVQFTGAAVIGIDFGSEYFKISLIAPGRSFVIIEN